MEVVIMTTCGADIDERLALWQLLVLSEHIRTVDGCCSLTVTNIKINDRLNFCYFMLGMHVNVVNIEI